jgi:maleate cis-trans isomerase
MYGYRARVGLIVPASNTTCEPEIAALCPEGVTAYATRIFFDPSSVDGLLALKKEADRAARELSCEGICQIIAFCCTSGSMVGGLNYDREITNMIEKESNTPAIATATPDVVVLTTGASYRFPFSLIFPFLLRTGVVQTSFFKKIFIRIHDSSILEDIFYKTLRKRMRSFIQSTLTPFGIPFQAMVKTALIGCPLTPIFYLTLEEVHSYV